MRRGLGRKAQGLWSELSLLFLDPTFRTASLFGNYLPQETPPPAVCVNFWLHYTNTWLPAGTETLLALNIVYEYI